MMRGRTNSTLSRGYGTLAGLGIIGAAIFAVPSTLLLDPVPSSESHLVTVAGLVTGLLCMALPWERMDLRWLHLVGVVATVETAVTVAVFGQSFTVLFFLIAASVAYVTPDLKALFAHLLMIGLALFGPVVLGPAGIEETLQVSLLVFPLLCLSTGVFSYLRRRMVADRSSYRVFAEETLSLATRIAGRPLSPGPLPTSAEFDLPSWPRHVRISSRVSGAVASVLALPLITAGLAAAGVRVPTFATDTLGSVGIELLNQEGSGTEAEAAMDPLPAPRRAIDQGRRGPEVVLGTGDSPAAGFPEGGQAEPGSETEGEVVTGGAEDPEVPSPSPSPSHSPSDGGNGGLPSGVGTEVGSGNGLDDALDDALDDTLDDIGGLLDGLGPYEKPEGRDREAPPPPES